LGQARRRHTLSQIDAYGFNAGAPVVAPRGLREAIGAAAALVGGRVVNRLGPERERELRTLLNSAGYYRTSAATFAGYRVFIVAVLLAWSLLVVSGTGVTIRGVLLVGVVSSFGWIFPKFVLQKRATKRLDLVDREVPELVDLLVTTVEAGVGFGGALQLAARSIEGPLGEELRLALQEQSMGLTTEEALRNLASRVDSPAIRAFIQGLVQGEALGVSIGKVLRDLAVDMRKRRRQAAEERAQKAPTKILFPLVLLILPAMFLVSLGPAAIQVLRTLGSS
jgi:tight adherence protein C